MSNEIKMSHFKDENELLENCNEWIRFDDGFALCRFFDIDCLKVLLNTIEELKAENKELRDTNQKLYDLGKQRAIQEILSDNWVSKDKIKKILGIEEDEEDNEEKILSLLQTIVAEFNRLEDIEDRKVEVAVDNIEKKRDKYWKDKIREVIGTPYPEIAIDNLLKLLEK
jgi:hypothetical protein